MREGGEVRKRMRERLAGEELGEGREVWERTIEAPIVRVLKSYERWSIWKGLLVHASCREVQEEEGRGEDNGLVVLEPKIEACEGGERRKSLVEFHSRDEVGERRKGWQREVVFCAKREMSEGVERREREVVRLSEMQMGECWSGGKRLTEAVPDSEISERGEQGERLDHIGLQVEVGEGSKIWDVQRFIEEARMTIQEGQGGREGRERMVEATLQGEMRERGREGDDGVRGRCTKAAKSQLAE